MTWTHYWIFIGIVYPIYYAVIITYDLIKQGRTEQNHAQLEYSVANIFGDIKPTSVSIEDYPPTSTSGHQIVQSSSVIEDEAMTTTELLAMLNDESMNIVSKIFNK